MKLDVRKRGQVFTPTSIVEYMASLIQNDGLVLEPSCGTGMFLNKIGSNYIAIELQEELCSYKHLNIDFFDYTSAQTIDTIIGNPPYVKHNDIETSTQDKLDYSLFDKRTNLYLFFIDKCINLLEDGGELIFITPRDFLKQTSSIRLNEKLFELGSFTHFNDLGDKNIFKGYTPNCAIWRWQKGLKTNILDDGRYIQCIKGQIIFTQQRSQSTLGEYLDVKVGGVSGADYIFETDSAKSIEFICSYTLKTSSTKRMLYDMFDKILLEHKEALINRRIKKFDESNWWQWGRRYTHRDGSRIYVNCKTRHNQPFFISDVPAYDGSMLALFPKDTAKLDIKDLCDTLNCLDWKTYGFMCGGRYIFSQRTLESLPIARL